MSRLESPNQLLENITRGHRPRSDWAIGLEYEQFVTRVDGTPVSYSEPRGVAAMLRRLQELTGWTAVEEAGNVLALRGEDGRSITLEPGAQIEFGSTPCKSLNDIQAEVAEYFSWLRVLRDEFDVRFVALGAQPAKAPDEIERIPKSRYNILEPYLLDAGELGVWMMKATAGIQMNFDHADAEDAALKMRTAFQLAPILTAIGANSPVRAGQYSGYATWRGHAWSKTDPTHCGIVEACTRPDSTIQDFVDWAVHAPMLFIQRDGQFLDLRGRSFHEYWQQGFDGHRATEEDWDLHLSTLFPEVRFRPQLELRCFDTQCPVGTLAVCALAKGLFYDDQALQQAAELTSHWSHAQRVQAWEDSHKFGLAAPAPGGETLGHYAARLLDFIKLPSEEEEYLQLLRTWVADGESPGERLGRRFREEWQGDIAELVDASACLRDASVTQG